MFLGQRLGVNCAIAPLRATEMKLEAEPAMPLDYIKCRLDSYRGKLAKTKLNIFFYPVVLIALNASGHHSYTFPPM